MPPNPDTRGRTHTAYGSAELLLQRGGDRLELGQRRGEVFHDLAREHVRRWSLL